jgi:hypothetical protein
MVVGNASHVTLILSLYFNLIIMSSRKRQAASDVSMGASSKKARLDVDEAAGRVDEIL